MDFDYNKLRGRIIEKFGSMLNFSKKLAISYAALSKKMNNGIGFSQEDIITFCNLLDIPLEQVGEYFFILKV